MIKGKIQQSYPPGDSFPGCFMSYAVNTLCIALARDGSKNDKKTGPVRLSWLSLLLLHVAFWLLLTL